MRITICGSMAFSAEMVQAKAALETVGHQVVLPQLAEEYAAGERNMQANESLAAKREHDAIRTHYREIKASDAILVVNITKHDTENYIGGNSLMEIGFAYVLEKKIFLLNSIPTMSYTDEIVACDPIVLAGDYSQIQ
jgi:nucleoside 2-deoxyribosyltransferase